MNCYRGTWQGIAKQKEELVAGGFTTLSTTSRWEEGKKERGREHQLGKRQYCHNPMNYMTFTVWIPKGQAEVTGTRDFESISSQTPTFCVAGVCATSSIQTLDAVRTFFLLLALSLKARPVEQCRRTKSTFFLKKLWFVRISPSRQSRLIDLLFSIKKKV